MRKFIRFIYNTLKDILLSFFIALSLFYIFFLITYDSVSYFKSVLKYFTISINNSSNILSYDHFSKRLIAYPKYGELFGTISFPDGNSISFIHGDSEEILMLGAGHYSGSFFPGEGGTIIVAGHNYMEGFKKLDKYKINDIITVNTSYGTFTYRIKSSKIITETENIEVKDYLEELVLYTCYPFDSIGYKSNRFVVFSTLEEFYEREEE